MATKKPSKAQQVIEKVKSIGKEKEPTFIEKVKVATGMKKVPAPTHTREKWLIYILVLLVVFSAGIIFGRFIGCMYGKGHMYKHGGYEKQMKYGKEYDDMMQGR